MVNTPLWEAILTNTLVFHSTFIVFTEQSLFHLSEPLLLLTAADPVDPVDPGKMVSEPALRPSLPRTPGVRMT